MPMKKFIVSARGSVMSVGPHSTMNLSAPSVTPCGIESAYVTHDQTEAMTLGDRVAVMRSGLLQQIGSPQDLYDNPDNPVRRRIHRITGHELLPRNARYDSRTSLPDLGVGAASPGEISMNRHNVRFFVRDDVNGTPR